MRHYLLFSFLMILINSLQAQIPARGELISDTLLHHYSKAEILAEYNSLGLPEFLAPIDYEIDVYKIVYWTLTPQGTGLTYASGVVLVPLAQPCGAPLMIHNHGTIIYDQDIPSNMAGEFIVGVPFSANGYVVAMPDYLGLGESPGRHPFVHAKSEATCGVDMLRATRNLCNQISTSLSGQTFIGGYSQGGHVAMALFKELETLHSAEFDVVAVGPGSGPYDISGVMRDYLLSNTANFTNAYYMSYVILSYQEIYGNLYNNLSEVFVSPYDVAVPLLFNRSGPQSSITLPLVATQMLQPAFLQGVLSDSLHPFNVALRDNNLYDWTPQAPLRMFYCEADEQVPYQNSLVAESAMLANNAPNIAAVSVGVNNNHESCALPAFLQAKILFDTRKDACDTSATAIDPRRIIDLSLSPNPFQNEFLVRWEEPQLGIREIRLLNLAGQSVHLQAVEHETQVLIRTKGLARGVYVLELISPTGRYYRKVLAQ